MARSGAAKSSWPPLATYRRAGAVRARQDAGRGPGGENRTGMALGYLLSAEAFGPEGAAAKAPWPIGSTRNSAAPSSTPGSARGRGRSSSAGPRLNAPSPPRRSPVRCRGEPPRHPRRGRVRGPGRRRAGAAGGGEERPSAPVRDRPAGDLLVYDPRRRCGRCWRPRPTAPPPNISRRASRRPWPPSPASCVATFVFPRASRPSPFRAASSRISGWPRPSSGASAPTLRGPHQPARPGERRRDQLRSGAVAGRAPGRRVLAALAARRSSNVPRHPRQGRGDQRRRPCGWPRRLRRGAQGGLPGVRARGRSRRPT